MSLIEPSPLRPLPVGHRWPRGWWLSEGMGCVGDHGLGEGQGGDGAWIEPGRPMYLTGAPGEALCERHASRETS